MAYKIAFKSEEDFLRKKSRAVWVRNGDGNNSYFFKFCKDVGTQIKLLSFKKERGSQAGADLAHKC